MPRSLYGVGAVVYAGSVGAAVYVLTRLARAKISSFGVLTAVSPELRESQEVDLCIGSRVACL